MRTDQFFMKFVDTRCHKVAHSEREYDKIKDLPNVMMVKATTLYQIYKHNVYPNEGRLRMKQFFLAAGQYFYYDKYFCDHGTEFYYYVKFNEDNDVYKATKPLIAQKVKRNSPEFLKDLKSIMKAVGKI